MSLSAVISNESGQLMMVLFSSVTDENEDQGARHHYSSVAKHIQRVICFVRAIIRAEIQSDLGVTCFYSQRSFISSPEMHRISLFLRKTYHILTKKIHSKTKLATGFNVLLLFYKSSTTLFMFVGISLLTC